MITSFFVFSSRKTLKFTDMVTEIEAAIQAGFFNNCFENV